MKHLLTLAMLVATASSTYSEPTATPPNQCTLKLAQSPAIRGIKLGMKLEQILAWFPIDQENAYLKEMVASRASFPNNGVISFGAAPNQHKVRDQFLGIQSLNFVFVDEQLVRYEVQYGWPDWPELDDFINKLADTFHLPRPGNWTGDPGRKRLSCAGFQLEALTRDGNARLVVKTNDEPFEIQRQRRAASEEKARRDFKP